jgi:hypothetical protein
MIDLPPENPLPKRKLRERDIEAYLVKEVAKRGGVAEKFSSPNQRSVPDRIVLWPRCLLPAIAVFVECKAPGEKPTSAQAKDHEWRRKMGFVVIVVDSYEAVDVYLGERNT